MNQEGDSGPQSRSYSGNFAVKKKTVQLILMSTNWIKIQQETFVFLFNLSIIGDAKTMISRATCYTLEKAGEQDLRWELKPRLSS